MKQTKPDAVTIAETWFDASKYFLGDTFDATMNYVLRNAILDFANGSDARKLLANLEHLREAYPPQAFHALMNLLSSHDQARALHVLGGTTDAAPEAMQKPSSACCWPHLFKCPCRARPPSTMVTRWA